MTVLRLRERAVLGHGAILRLLTGAETLIIFACGLGRYRSLLVLGMFFFATGVIEYMKKSYKVLSLMLGPVLLFSLYIDVRSGQVLPVFPGLPFLVTVVSLALIDVVLVRGLACRTLIRWSNGSLFRTCPRCSYSNRSLVNECGQCSYRNDSGSDKRAAQYPEKREELNALIEETAGYRKAGLKQPSGKIRGLLTLDEDEVVLTSLRIFPLQTLFRDGERTLASIMILTTKGVIFLQSLFFEVGWKMREQILYDDIIEIAATTKRVTTTKEPTLAIKTRSHQYEVCFMALFPYREQIKAITSCITRRATTAIVRTDTEYNSLP
jgi:hypothetical protein